MNALLAALIFGYRKVKWALADVPVRDTTNYVGNVTVIDDSTNKCTTVNVGAGPARSGQVTVDMLDADYTLATGSEINASGVVCESTPDMTADRSLFVVLPALEGTSYFLFVANDQAGLFNVQVQAAGAVGGAFPVPNATSSLFWVNVSGVHVVAAGETYP